MNNIEDFLPQKRTTVLEFFVNGKKVTEPQPDPEWTLLWYLRKKLHLTGTKYGCGEGGCGACTVMISQYIKDEDRIKHYAVNACLMPLCTVHGMAITTVEGIGSTQDKLHPVQERIAKTHGSQCGFCTPGIVMSMYTLLRTKHKIDYNDIDTALQGNLCRCTGYRPIIEGFKTFIEEWEYHYDTQTQAGGKSLSPCMMGKDCCRVNNKEIKENDSMLYKRSEFIPYNPSQEPIFPPELKINNNYYFSSLTFFKGPNITWVRPLELEDLLLLKKEFPSSKLVAGNTEVGVEVKFKKMVYPLLISPILIKELSFIRLTDEGIEIGAAATLSDIMTFFADYEKENNYKGKSFGAIKDMLHWFAGTQIRNTASLVGNIITASPISDLNPILLACSASLVVKSLDRGERKLSIDTNFFKGYRKVALCDDEVVLFVQIPFTKNDQYLKAYKQAKRREDDISIVTAAFNVEFEKDSLIIADAKLCFGGMAPTTVCAIRTSNLMKGKTWDQLMLKSVFDSLTGEFQLDSSVPGGMAEYRKSLCLSLFFRFYLYILEVRSINGTKPSNYELSGSNQISALHPKSTQCYEIKNNTKNEYVSVGKPIVHMSALKQATGEAIYCDDLPTMEEELYLALLFSKESYARIKSIDASRALAMPGVVAFFSAADLPKGFRMGPVIKDEEVFVEDIVTSRSCIVGAIVAVSEQIARKAKDIVSVSYERIEPVIVTIEDAIEHESYFPGSYRKLVHGKVNDAFKQSNHIKDGYIRIGAQEHFYLETISAFALRKEEELEIICSSQNPAEVALTVSQVLNIPNHKIISKAKRLGGGFGGKETRPLLLILPVAFAAYRLKKPVRGVLDRDEDMQGSGYRHPCLIKYKVGFDETGKINGVVFDVYANGGNYSDISCSMLERIMTHLDNCCKIPNIEINLNLCKTNTPSNTAFRGFGAPQAMFATESLLRDVAASLNKDYEDIINVNMYHEGDLTYYDQKLIHCTISRCWSECIESSNYWQRKKNVEEFNRLNRWKKKGITLIPTKYGISFQIDLLMQGGALILVYTDGSVLLTIGGVEMGQGLFTKMIQVASSVLEIDVTKIHISEMSTDKVPNSSPTAASVSSDLYGMAVLNACTTIKERLAPIKASNPNGTWEDWVATAYLERVSLSATGFYAAPKIEFNSKTNSGRLFEYYTFGVACSEVIIDCLTGDHQVLRTDIVMDIGDSLNPAIDIGQIEGGFMQGYGLFTMEEMLYSPSGEILSRGPGAYKIPGFSDIPKEFNVSLLKGAPNPRAVYSSKAVGEPPLFLAASVYFAIKEAIKAARIDAGVDPNFVLEAPATCARIRMACEDHITQQVIPTIKNVGRPWNVTP